MPRFMPASVFAVARASGHRFSKQVCGTIRLIAGLGVEGDAHAGVTAQHLSRKRRDPSAPNLRQVHLIHRELFDELAREAFAIEPGQMGENLTTRGIDLLALSRGTRLRLGGAAEIEITGLRNPCTQLDRFRPGLTAAVLDRAEDGALVRKAGVMAIVIAGGEVRPGDAIAVVHVPDRHEPLDPV
ncbi:MAG: MOSC domain-containing protein [Paracoccaceae bacterium]